MIFYGHMLGMTKKETLCTRHGEMLDLISCLSIYNGSAVPSGKAGEKEWTFEEAMLLK